MNRLGLLFLLILGVSLVGRAATQDDAARDSERRILVMLHLPLPHFRPDANYAGGYEDDSGHSARRRIATDMAREYGLKLDSDWPMPALDVHCFVMEQTTDEPPERVARILSQDPRVEWAQPMRRFHALGASDPLSPLQPGERLWHLSSMHTLATGRRVRVAVVDSGIEADHPDLAGQVEAEENFVDGDRYTAETHGTAVAGIIAARAGNGIGIAGVAPDARLLALRACWEASANDTECNSFTLGKALHAAILHEVQVINLSLTGPPDRLLQRLLDAALARGIKIVGAIDPHSADGGFPASYPGVFAVADQPYDVVRLRKADILIAPGRDVVTTMPGARWNFVSGPSFAAAHVSGLVALLTELRPALAASRMRRELVVESADARMAGTIDACATVANSAESCPCLCAGSDAVANRHR
ncbi:MAG: S8 family peptidase [Bacillota bacterium]